MFYSRARDTQVLVGVGICSPVHDEDLNSEETRKINQRFRILYLNHYSFTVWGALQFILWVAALKKLEKNYISLISKRVLQELLYCLRLTKIKIAHLLWILSYYTKHT